MDDAMLAEWGAAFTAYHARFARFFRRSEARARSRRYLEGLLAPVERKNGWQVAEAVGEADPQGIQRLLYEAVWDADAVRDAYQQFVVEQFGDPEAILVLDETGFLKKGEQSVGVQRQYSGTAGKVENCQLGVFLAYVTTEAHLLLDRRLYLPAVWTSDPSRRAAAKVPEAVAFATMPQLALAMLEQAWAQDVPHAWVTADERYGGDPHFLAALEARNAQYVLAVPSSTRVWGADTRVVDVSDRLRVLDAAAPTPATVAAVVAGLAPDGWQRLVVGAGSKGPRVDDWAAVRVVASRAGWPGPTLWLLARRSVSDPTAVAYYLAHAAADTTLATLARVAASRWPIEQCFEEAKGEAGLDQYEVRHWHSWHRHITLAMLAHGFVAWQRREAGGKGAADHAADGAPQCAGDSTLARVRPATAAAHRRAGAPLVALATPPSSARRRLSLPSPARTPLRIPQLRL